MAVYALGSLGALALERGEKKAEGGIRQESSVGFRRIPPSAFIIWLALAVHTAVWTGRTSIRARRIQRAENQIRREIGLWLRQHTPPGARVAAEPIGYIGYYSGRPILDEVGLVSPRMIPLNRAGDGWFGKMLRAERPEYVVERYYYLTRNETLNTGVRMFAEEADRTWFREQYRPVRYFCWDLVERMNLSPMLTRDYGFVIFARRTSRHPPPPPAQQ
jgi:hypothetical protein